MDTTRPHRGAKVALFLGDQLVCLLRDDDPQIPYPNLWDLPGGGREGDETTFQTVVRETYEELGLVLSHDCVVWEHPFPSRHDPQNWHAFFVAQMSAASVDDIVFGDEGQRWGLYDLDAFLALEDAVPFFPPRLEKWLDKTGGFAP